MKRQTPINGYIPHPTFAAKRERTGARWSDVVVGFLCGAAIACILFGMFGQAEAQPDPEPEHKIELYAGD